MNVPTLLTEKSSLQQSQLDYQDLESYKDELMPSKMLSTGTRKRISVINQANANTSGISTKTKKHKWRRKRSAASKRKNCSISRTLNYIAVLSGLFFILFILRQTDKQQTNKQQNGKQQIPEWDKPFVHIVNTRFMQDQSDLEMLGRARIKLFETFCLKTMIGQTALPDILWIIKTDPNLDVSLRNQVVQLLQPYPNFYFIGSNVNDFDGNGAWRGGLEGERILDNIRNGQVYSGDLNLLRSAIKFADEKAVLETRLDADDGLQKYYLEFVQMDAAMKFGLGDDYWRERENYHKLYNHTKGGIDAYKVTLPSTPAKWLYWCSKAHIVWYEDPVKEKGRVSFTKHNKLCVTPGLTAGFNIGTSYDEVIKSGHQTIFKTITKNKLSEKSCGMKSMMDCISLVNYNAHVPVATAIRSRTSTSAGMQFEDIFLDSKTFENRIFKEITNSGINISINELQKTNAFFQDNKIGILEDNLRGQCTPGHSCKFKSSEMLLRQLEVTNVERGGNAGVNGGASRGERTYLSHDSNEWISFSFSN